MNLFSVLEPEVNSPGTNRVGTLPSIILSVTTLVSLVDSLRF